MDFAQQFVVLLATLTQLVDYTHNLQLAPGPRTLQSDLTLLANNDLYGQVSSNNQSALLLSRIHSHQDAAKNCSALNEGLYSPQPSTSALLTYLSYLDNTTSDDLYWVNGKSDLGCNALNRDGKHFLIDCNTPLQALCSQSAPLATVSSSDSSQKYRMKVVSGNQTFTGFRDRRSFRFLGIPYALPPRRFQHSFLYNKLANHDATSAGSICSQSGPQPGSEDCLFANVWTPYLPLDQTSSNLKPVLFWIHGGAFESGAGSLPLFDGGNMASRGDIVVVTFNYRLGTLGFLAMDDGITTGNWGLGDQVTALDWVQQNIKSFGGDPENITIAGQSAGAASVRALLGSPKAIGKYAAAIMQSNLGGYNFAESYSKYYNISKQMSDYVQPILDQTKCAAGSISRQLECLKAYSSTKLANLNPQASYLSVDKEYITQDHLILDGSSPVANVPIIMGTMTDDAVLFIDNPWTANLTNALSFYDYNASVLTNLQDYPITSTSPLNNMTMDVWSIVNNATMDAFFTCVDQATAAASTKNKIFPNIWYYEFDRAYGNWGTRPQCVPPPSVGRPFGDPDAPYYKCHSGDVAYTFGSISYQQLPDRDGFDIPFSQYILDSWAQFAWHHDPNPDMAFLQARGYESTAAIVEQAGPWNPVGNTPNTYKMRRLQKDIIDIPFKDTQQCKHLNLPIDMYM